MSGDENQILSTTTRDIERLEKLVVGNTVRNLRIAQKRVNRRLLIFQRRLIELRNNESIIKARIYNNADMVTLQKDFLSGQKTRVNPQQSYESQQIAPDPHHAVSYDKFNITSTIEGIKELDSELNRINTEIKIVERQVERYETLQKNIDDRLEAAEESEDTQKNLIDKTVGRVLPPTPEDLKQDEISRAEIANVSLLYRLSVYYAEMSEKYNQEGEKTGERAFGDENKLPKNLLMIRQIFWAHAQSFSEFIDEDSRDKLNFNDPGDVKNQNTLFYHTQGKRYTAENSKTSVGVDRYMRDLKNVTNDTTISRGIERKPDPTLPISESLNAKTESYPATAIRLGDKYLGSFELPTFTKAIKKWFKNKNEQLYYNLPICPNKTTEFETSSDTKISAYNAVQKELIAKGEALYRKKLDAAKKTLGDQEAVNLGDIPHSAPDFVKTFAQLYGDGFRGAVSYKEAQLIVGRGEAEEEVDARINAEKLAPEDSSVVNSYSYFSVEGYTVTYKNGSTQIVPLRFWNAFQQDKAKSGSVVSQEVKGTYVNYLMWADEEQRKIIAGS